jgi:hypothetical protein
VSGFCRGLERARNNGAANANPPIKLNHLHPPPSAITPKGYLLPEFYSAATGPTGRFNEGFLLRRLQERQVPVFLIDARLKVTPPLVAAARCARSATRRPRPSITCQAGSKWSGTFARNCRVGFATQWLRHRAGLLAHAVVSKFNDHLPLYCQAEIFARDGVGLETSTLSGWLGWPPSLMGLSRRSVRRSGTESSQTLCWRRGS